MLLTRLGTTGVKSPALIALSFHELTTLPLPVKAEKSGIPPPVPAENRDVCSGTWQRRRHASRGFFSMARQTERRKRSSALFPGSRGRGLLLCRNTLFAEIAGQFNTDG